MQESARERAAFACGGYTPQHDNTCMQGCRLACCAHSSAERTQAHTTHALAATPTQAGWRAVRVQACGACDALGVHPVLSRGHVFTNQAWLLQPAPWLRQLGMQERDACCCCCVTAGAVLQRITHTHRHRHIHIHRHTHARARTHTELLLLYKTAACWRACCVLLGEQWRQRLQTRPCTCDLLLHGCVLNNGRNCLSAMRQQCARMYCC